MRLAKFTRDVDAECKVMGIPIRCVFGTERESPNIVTDDVAIFEYAPDQWTGADVAPGGPYDASGQAPAVATRYVGVKVDVRGIDRTNGATRDEHTDHVSDLVEYLMCAIERVRKRNRWLESFGSGAMAVPGLGEQPEQGARYELQLRLGIPVCPPSANPTVDGSQLVPHGTTKALSPDGQTADTVGTT